MLTHFQIIIGVLIGLGTILSGIFGRILRLSNDWIKMKDLVAKLSHDLEVIVTRREIEHSRLEERITRLEKRRWF